MRSKIFTRTVGYWPLQEASRQALDYSGNENHASTTNVSNYSVSGPVGSSSMDFDASSNDRVEIPGSDGGAIDIYGNKSISVAIWVKLDDYSTSTSDVFAIQSSGESTIDKLIRIETGGDISWYLFDGSGSHLRATSAAQTNEWMFIVGTFDGSNQKIYVDGVLENQTTFSGSQNHSTPHAHIGSQNTDGQIAHVRVWDYPLPEASIRALYDASRGGFSQSNSKNL